MNLPEHYLASVPYLSKVVSCVYVYFRVGMENRYDNDTFSLFYLIIYIIVAHSLNSWSNQQESSNLIAAVQQNHETKEQRGFDSHNIFENKN